MDYNFDWVCNYSKCLLPILYHIRGNTFTHWVCDFRIFFNYENTHYKPQELQITMMKSHAWLCVKCSHKGSIPSGTIPFFWHIALCEWRTPQFSMCLSFTNRINYYIRCNRIYDRDKCSSLPSKISTLKKPVMNITFTLQTASIMRWFDILHPTIVLHVGLIRTENWEGSIHTISTTFSHQVDGLQHYNTMLVM